MWSTIHAGKERLIALSRRQRGRVLFFTAVAAIAAVVYFLWLGPEFARGRREQAAVGSLKGVAAVDTTWTGSVVEVHLKGVDGDAVKKLAELELPELSSVKATQCKIADDDFAVFAKFPRLQFLDLTATPVSDAAIAHLVKLKQLTHLVLKSTGVEFAGVDRLQKAVPGIDITY